MNPTFTFVSNFDFRELLDENGHFTEVPLLNISQEELQETINTLYQLGLRIQHVKEKAKFDEFILQQAHKLKKITGDHRVNLGVKEILEETAYYFKDKE